MTSTSKKDDARGDQGPAPADETLDREALLAMKSVRVEKIDGPAPGTSTYVKGLTGAERDWWEDSVILPGGKRDLKNLRAKLAALSLCDKKGNKIFRWGDVQELGELPVEFLDRVYESAMRLSGLRAKDAEASAGNSPSGRNSESTTD